MHLITTHQNADFDAVASLSAAHKLYPDATPVLPSAVNRGVQEFLTLYGRVFPFVKTKHLTADSITRLTIVDTSNLPNLKQTIDPTTLPIHIIDHHHPPEHPTPNMTLSMTDTGATVTRLVEQMQAQGIRPTSLESTLYLLGIYADTGALTYGTTTPRDLQAAAWLLGEGQAQLDLVREHLTPRLNSGQIDLYNLLLNQQETLTVHGQTIILATAELKHYVSEVSTIAHQLRDLYNVAALLILVEMVHQRGKRSRVIQFIARSSTDAVDVGQLATALGGGGHARAAAASLKPDHADSQHKTLAAVKQTLLHVLPTAVQPAMTVAEIMSRGVHTLTPTDTIQRAVTMIDRYGHEGFPVVDAAQRIVGLLSRREVDKAQRHGLTGAPIEQFMLKGRFQVYPTDSVEAVRDLMVTQRIGQVPVVAAETEQLLGIVTRTDLIRLRNFAERSDPPTPNLTTPLTQRLSDAVLDLLRQAGELARAQGANLYIVGGFVRDLLLTVKQASATEQAKTSPRFDLDLVVEGAAIPLAEQLQTTLGGRIHTHERFGTAKWLLPQPLPFDRDGRATLSALDFATARTEFYRHPSALPEVEQSSIRSDLHRRDFTINTLALHLNPAEFGRLLDFYNGQVDLEVGLIRVLHSLSFIEDPTRLLRAARLLARLDFQLESRTAELLTHALEVLDQVTPARIWHELELIFKEREPSKAVQKLAELHILTAIHPALTVDAWLSDKLASAAARWGESAWAQQPLQPIHYLGLLCYRLSAVQLEIIAIARLNLPQSQQHILQRSHHLRDLASDLAQPSSNSQLFVALHDEPPESRAIVWLATDDSAVRQQLTRFETELRHVSPLIDGSYLKRAFHLSPGPIFKTILDTLRAARLDGQVETLTDEHALVEQMVREI